MKTIAINLLGVLLTTNAMASVKCFVQTAGETKALEVVKAYSPVMEASIGSIEATALMSLESENEVTDLQIKDASRNFSVLGVSIYNLSLRPAVLYVNIGDARVSLTCSK